MTRVFLSHHKCATNWLARNIGGFAALEPGARVFATHVTNGCPRDLEQWAYVFLANAAYVSSKSLLPAKAVHVIRNPLSIIVSAYFSHRYVHGTSIWPELELQREKLRRASKRVGLELTAEFLECPDFGAGAAGPLFSLRNWDFGDDGMLTVRMEDLVMYPVAMFGRIFEFFGETMSSGFASVIEANSFAELSGGRKPGQSDPASHYRSGSATDWTNHLSYWQAKRYYRRYSALLDRFYPEVSRLF